MGSSYTKPVVLLQNENKQLRVFISGLDSAGKTTVLHVTKYGKDVTILPTIGLNMEIIEINNISIAAMDEGGRSGIRALQRLHYRGTSGLIFVVDTNDRERINEARDKLHQMSNEEELRNKPILIFANKQDLSNSTTFDEIRDKLNLTKLNENTKWHFQPACVIQDEGLKKGFKWLANSMVEKFDSMKPIVETLNDTKKVKKDLMSILNIPSLKTLLNKFV